MAWITVAMRSFSCSCAMRLSIIACSFLASSYSEFSAISPNSRASLMRSATSRRFSVDSSSSSSLSFCSPSGVRMTSFGNVTLYAVWFVAVLVARRATQKPRLTSGDSHAAQWRRAQQYSGRGRRFPGADPALRTHRERPPEHRRGQPASGCRQAASARRWVRPAASAHARASSFRAAHAAARVRPAARARGAGRTRGRTCACSAQRAARRGARRRAPSSSAARPAPRPCSARDSRGAEQLFEQPRVAERAAREHDGGSAGAAEDGARVLGALQAAAHDHRRGQRPGERAARARNRGFPCGARRRSAGESRSRPRRPRRRAGGRARSRCGRRRATRSAASR